MIKKSLFLVFLFTSLAVQAKDSCTFQNQGVENVVMAFSQGKQLNIPKHQIRFIEGDCKGEILQGRVLVCFTSANDIDCNLVDSSKNASSNFDPAQVHSSASKLKQIVKTVLPSFLFSQRKESIASAKAAGDQKNHNGFPFGHVLHSDPLIIYADIPSLFKKRNIDMGNIVENYPKISAIELSENCSGSSSKFKPEVSDTKFSFKGLPNNCEYKYTAVIEGKKRDGSFTLIDPDKNELFFGLTDEIETVLSKKNADPILRDYQVLLLLKDFGLAYDSEIMAVQLAEKY
ncbi:MAG: hypothetical protein Alis3KO_13170 [Aliiglaciecola sp.]